MVSPILENRSAQIDFEERVTLAGGSDLDLPSKRSLGHFRAQREDHFVDLAVFDLLEPLV